jgi:hypothetical protein
VVDGHTAMSPPVYDARHLRLGRFRVSLSFVGRAVPLPWTTSRSLKTVLPSPEPPADTILPLTGVSTISYLSLPSVESCRRHRVVLGDLDVALVDTLLPQSPRWFASGPERDRSRHTSCKSNVVPRSWPGTESGLQYVAWYKTALGVILLIVVAAEVRASETRMNTGALVNSFVFAYASHHILPTLVSPLSLRVPGSAARRPRT